MILYFFADAKSQPDVLIHDSDAVGVDGAEIGVLEEAHQVGLGGFLEGLNRTGLKADVRLEVLDNPLDQAEEGFLVDEQVRILLVGADVHESLGVWTEPVRLAYGLLGCHQVLRGVLP